MSPEPTTPTREELLRLCDQVLYEPAVGETLGHIADVCKIARALKQHLTSEPAGADRAGEVIALRSALRNMADAYVRKVKTGLSAEDIAKEPWRCAEYIEAINALAKPPLKLHFTEAWLREKIMNDPDLPCEAGSMERAARVAESYPADKHGHLSANSHEAAAQAASEIAAAIRALEHEPAGPTPALREKIARILWDRENPISDEHWAALPDEDVSRYGEWETGKGDYLRDADAILALLAASTGARGAVDIVTIGRDGETIKGAEQP